jgi:uncharacterized phage protein (TIGR02218 family)
MIVPQNETTPGAVKAMLLAQEPHHCDDLWTFVLTCGITLRWTSSDIDRAVGANTFLSQVAISRDVCTLTTGLETATQEVTVSPSDTEDEMEIAGIPLRQAIRGGLFDGASVRLEWAYYKVSSPLDLVGTVLRFTGNVGDIDCYGAKAKLTINSPLKRLDQEIPWKAYGAGCRHYLGDSQCGVDLSAYAVAGTVLSGSTNGTVKTSLVSADKAWDGGVVLVTTTSGAAFRRSIRTNVGGTLYLRTPLPWAPQAGDDVSATPGCDKSKPELASVSRTETIPAGLTIAVATESTFATDNGVILIGEMHVTPGYWTYLGGEHLETIWVEPVTTKDPDIAMVKVSGTPTTGQYALSGNVYTFAADDIGRDVTISAQTATGGEKGCWRFANLARFGGMPFIPAPETAY